MHKVLFAQAVVASLKEDFKTAKVSKGKPWYSQDAAIFSAKVEASDTGVLKAYTRDLSEGEETYQKMVLSNGGHCISMETESEAKKGADYKNTENWRNLKDAFLIKPFEQEAEFNSPIWSQRLTHEAGAACGGDCSSVTAEEQGDEVDADAGTTLVRRLQGSSLLQGLNGFKQGPSQILEVYRIMHTKEDKLIITQIRREPTSDRKSQQVYALEGSYSYQKVVDNSKFDEPGQGAVYNNKLFKYKQALKGQYYSYVFCFENYCRAIVREIKQGMRTVRQEVKADGSNGEMKITPKTGDHFLTWHSRNENVAKKVDFAKLDKECSDGKEVKGWTKGVKLTYCEDKGIAKLQQGDFIYIVKEKGDVLEEASSENIKLSFEGDEKAEEMGFENTDTDISGVLTDTNGKVVALESNAAFTTLMVTVGLFI